MPLDPAAWKLASDRLNGGAKTNPLAQHLEMKRAMAARAQGLNDALVYSPSQIKAEAETTNTIISQLYRDTEANKKIPQATRNAFYSFCNEWVAYYQNHTGWTDRLWFSTLEKITNYRRRAEEWRKTLAKQGLKPTAPPDNVPTPGIGEGAIPWKLIILGGVAVAGAFVVWKIITGAMGAAQLGEAEEAAMAIAEAEEAKKSKKRRKSLYSIT